jgi:hypothetical protein
LQFRNTPNGSGGYRVQGKRCADFPHPRDVKKVKTRKRLEFCIVALPVFDGCSRVNTLGATEGRLLLRHDDGLALKLLSR